MHATTARFWSRRRSPGRHRRRPGRVGLRRTALNTASAFTLSVAFTLFGCALLPMTWGWRALVVTSGSMSPGIVAGDVVVIDPDDTGRLHPGDIVSFRYPGGRLVTHRVVGRDAGGNYTTKGDANPQPDPQPLTVTQVAGRVRLLVPYLGTPSLLLQEVPPSAVTVGVLPVVLLLVVRRRFRMLVGAVTGLAVAGAGTPLIRESGTTRAAWVGSSSADMDTATVSTFTYANAVLASDPVSYWRLSESGTARDDRTGVTPLTCTGVTAGAPGALPSDSDTATGFPAPTAFCQAGGGSAASLAGPFTVIAWARASSWPQTPHGRIVAKYNTGTNQLNYMLAWDYAGTSIRALVDTSGGRFQAIKAIPAGTGWHEFAMTWNGSVLKLYVDGVSADGLPAAGVLTTNTAAVTLGSAAGQTAAGDIDDVSIFDRALTSTQIANLHSLA